MIECLKGEIDMGKEYGLEPVEVSPVKTNYR